MNQTLTDRIDSLTTSIFEEGKRYTESIRDNEPFESRRDLLQRMRALQKELDTLHKQLKP